jgi:hypothetical protein
MERLSARPHHEGSAADKANAEWILAKFREWGWQADIEQFDVLFPTPKERRLELVEPTKFTAALEEPTVAADPTSGQKSEQLPSYNAYSIDGDVTAPLVYVNYGRPEDYTAGSPRHLGAGRDCHRPLRPVVARHQAEGRRRARRDRLPDLFRSPGRWVCGGRRVPGRSDAAGWRRPARQRHGHAGGAR